MSRARWSLGLMTGTALDGEIDVALIQTDGERVSELGPWALVPYEPETLDLIERAVEAARRWGFEGAEPPELAAAERALTDAQARAVARTLDDHGIGRDAVATIGFHGQTVLHRAPAPGAPGATRQLGDGPRMARALGIDTVTGFRERDVAAGGQGAPLAPIYHRALLERVGAAPGTAVLNLGGVANLTCLDGADTIGFDVGPANGPIDDWVRSRTGEPMDRDGRLAAAGTVDEARLARLLEHPYLGAPWPKSLDRFDFGAGMADGLDAADGAATLTAFAAAAVARAFELLPVPVASLVLCGGGRRNPALVAELERRTGVPAIDADALGLRGDAIEAECFAFLAERTRRALPIGFPRTTGVATPLTGGTLHRPDAPRPERAPGRRA